ncbi:MAG: PEP-CTERM sorting domain-containing protein [Cyanobacteria bacterium J06636_16]
MKYLIVSLLVGAGFSLVTAPAQATSLKIDFEITIDAVGDTLDSCLPDECIAPTFTPLAVGDTFTGAGITADLGLLNGIGEEELELDSFSFSYIDFFTGEPVTYTKDSFGTNLGDYAPVALFQDGQFAGIQGASSAGYPGEITRVGYASLQGDTFEGYGTINEFTPGMFVYNLDYVADGTIAYIFGQDLFDAPSPKVPEPSLILGFAAVLGFGTSVRMKRAALK